MAVQFGERDPTGELWHFERIAAAMGGRPQGRGPRLPRSNLASPSSSQGHPRQPKSTLVNLGSQSTSVPSQPRFRVTSLPTGWSYQRRNGRAIRSRSSSESFLRRVSRPMGRSRNEARSAGSDSPTVFVPSSVRPWGGNPDRAGISTGMEYRPDWDPDRVVHRPRGPVGGIPSGLGSRPDWDIDRAGIPTG